MVTTICWAAAEAATAAAIVVAVGLAPVTDDVADQPRSVSPAASCDTWVLPQPVTKVFFAGSGTRLASSVTSVVVRSVIACAQDLWAGVPTIELDLGDIDEWVVEHSAVRLHDQDPADALVDPVLGQPAGADGVDNRLDLQGGQLWIEQHIRTRLDRPYRDLGVAVHLPDPDHPQRVSGDHAMELQLVAQHARSAPGDSGSPGLRTARGRGTRCARS